MTLQNGMICGSRAILWSDTAWINGADGELAWYGTKAFQGILWPFAGTVSTLGGNPYEISRDIGLSYPMNVDQLQNCAIRAARDFCKDGGFARVLLAAYDGRKPRLIMIASDGIGLGPPFEPLEMANYISSANRSAAFLEAQEHGMTRARMSRIIDCQTTTPFDGEGPLANLGSKVWIGGEVERTEVSPKGVETFVERELEKREVEAA